MALLVVNKAAASSYKQPGFMFNLISPIKSPPLAVAHFELDLH